MPASPPSLSFLQADVEKRCEMLKVYENCLECFVLSFVFFVYKDLIGSRIDGSSLLTEC